MLEQTCEIIYFGPAIQEISCKDFLIFIGLWPFYLVEWKSLCNTSGGHFEEHSYEIIQNSDQGFYVFLSSCGHSVRLNATI